MSCIKYLKGKQLKKQNNINILFNVWEMKYYRPYHLVDSSPWPFLGGCSGLSLVVGGILYMHYGQIWLVMSGILFVGIIMVV